MTKKFLWLATIVPFASFAQESGENPFDLDKAGEAAGQISSALSDLIKGDVLDGALLVLAALVVLWVLFKIPRWVGAGRK